MIYLLVKEERIADFLDFLDPGEEIKIKCLLDPKGGEKCVYEVSGLSPDFIVMIMREHEELLA